MFYGGQFGVGGQSDVIFHDVNEIHWGGDNNRLQIINAQSVIDGASRDAGATPTSVLRIGLIMGQIAATKKYKQFDPDATDGSQVPVGVLGVELTVVDPATGANIDKQAPVVLRAPLRASALRVLGDPLIGHAAEFLIRSAFVRSGNFWFDDDPAGILSGRISRSSTKVANYTVLESETGTLFQATTGAVTFTLPARKEGLVYEFVRASNHAMVINGGDGHIVAVNTQTASSVTFNTASQQLGARARFECVNLAGTLKWIYTLLSTGTTGTVA